MSETIEKMPLGDRRKYVRQFREQKGWTLVELKEASGVSQPMLSQFENGERDLSRNMWKRLYRAITKAQVEDVYSGIERRFGTDARAELAEEMELIAVLQDNLDNEAHPKTRIWLALEMEAAQAQKRALDAAVLAHAERYPNESSDRMTIFPATKTAEGKTAPWKRRKKESRFMERISAAAAEDDFRVCLAMNPKHEAELRAAGWKEVKSE